MRAVRETSLTLLTSLTVLLAVASWSRIATGMGHAAAPLIITGLVVAGAGVALRLTGTPRLLIVVVQLALAWSVVSIRLTHTPIPLRYAPRMRLENAFVAAGDTIARSVPPVPVVGGVLPVILCGAALSFVLADLLARTLRLPALGGLVLLTMLAVPIAVMGSDAGVTGAARTGVSPWLFALVAAGWLAQVVLAESERLQRWGRRLDPDEGAYRDTAAASPASRAVAGTVAVGGAATALALVVPLAIPTMHVSFAGFGPGGAGGGRVVVTNPMVDVQRNLVQGADIPLIRVRTSDPDPRYLRIAVLTNFSARQWSGGPRQIPANQNSHGAVPIAGLDPTSEHEGITYPYTISVDRAFSSRWLPTPAPIEAIDADGDWRYDITTDDFIAVPKSLTTAGLTYSATAVRTDLTAAQLDGGGTGAEEVPATFTAVPADLPPIVADLAHRVTRGATTPLEQAVALQDWFSFGGHFIYSTATSLGSGADDLATFLGTGPDGRTGYCQQFAAAMAAMARILGIPARVAVGFLNPNKQADGSYLFSSHDMHAWPELYFPGAGWVRFEPTPAAAGTTLPTYARENGVGQAAPSGGPSASASSTPLDRARLKPLPDSDQPDGAAAAKHRHVQHHVGLWLGGAAVAGLLAAALVLPGAVRRRRRRTRLGGSAEDAWAELRDTVIDLGIPWADGCSPRAIRRLLERYVGTHEGHVALDTLVDAVERERYADRPTAIDVDVVLAAIEGMEQGEAPKAVRRARWWPRSVLRRRAITTDAPELDRVG